MTIYCKTCSLIHDENNCQEDTEKALEFVENNPIELTEQDMENFIENNEDTIYQIAEKEGYFEGMSKDQIVDSIEGYVVNQDPKELVEKIRAYQESN
jgi:hypothetical protein